VEVITWISYRRGGKWARYFPDKSSEVIAIKGRTMGRVRGGDTTDIDDRRLLALSLSSHLMSLLVLSTDIVPVDPGYVEGV
jgi:hypothetical protein